MTVALRSVPQPTLPETSAEEREDARLADLDRYDILDTPREEAFDRLTRFAKKLFGVPMATVSFMDAHRQWYKANEGLADPEAPRLLTFCRQVVETGDPLVVTDAARDKRFSENPYVTEDGGVRFYASVPLKSDTGSNIGTFCVIDTAPRAFPDSDMRMLNDLAQMAMAEMELRRLSTDDSLTGVLSRHGFRERAGRELALSRRHHEAMSCVMFDLDHFKAVNDTHGHAAGDAVLAQTARAIAAMLRATDIIGRVGGEEFAIVLPQTDLKGAQETAEKLRARIAALPITVGERLIHVTASFGVAARDQSIADLDALLSAADKALYEAKNNGRNRVVVAAPPPVPRAPQHRVLKSGHLVFNGGTSVISCTVRSLSGDGAGIDVSSTLGIPKRFTLQIKADNLTRTCVVAAHTDRHLEVTFEAERTAAA